MFFRVALSSVILFHPTVLFAWEQDPFWGISTPEHNYDSPHNDTLAVTGWGTDSSTFTLEVWVEGDLKKTLAGSTSPVGNIVENVPLPPGASVWTENFGQTVANLKLKVSTEGSSVEKVDRQFFFYQSGGPG